MATEVERAQSREPNVNREMAKRKVRRDPNLSPDEDLYVEDRDYTEAVIGHRPRRAKKPDEKDAT